MMATGFPMSNMKRAFPILATLCMVLSLVPTATSEMVDEELEHEPRHPHPVPEGFDPDTLAE